MKTSIHNNVITLRWTLPQTYRHNIDTFEIYRRAKGIVRYEMIGIVPAEFNALGVAQSYYEFTDTRSSQSTYSYQILGLMDNGEKEILDDHTIILPKKRCI